MSLTTVQAEMIPSIATLVAQVAANSPSGSVLLYAGSSAPTGFLLCDGSSVLRATYPGLFSAIGTTYGSVDGTHFNLPNTQGIFVRGAGSQTINDVLSPAVQLVGLLRATCTFPTTGSVGMKLAGKCSFSFALNKTPIALQTNIGSGWGNLATGSISGNTISPSITPKKSGKLQVRLISPGQIGLYSSFISNISIIQIAASKKH